MPPNDLLEQEPQQAQQESLADRIAKRRAARQQPVPAPESAAVAPVQSLAERIAARRAARQGVTSGSSSVATVPAAPVDTVPTVPAAPARMEGVSSGASTAVRPEPTISDATRAVGRAGLEPTQVPTSRTVYPSGRLTTEFGAAPVPFEPERHRSATAHKQIDYQGEDSGWLDRAGDYVLTAVKGAIGVPETAVGMADLAKTIMAALPPGALPGAGNPDLTNVSFGKLAERVGFKPKEAKKLLDAYYSDAQQNANAKMANASGVVEKMKVAAQNPSVIAHNVLESLPVMAAGGVVGRVAGAAGAADYLAGAIGEGLTTAGQNIEQTRQESATGTLDARQTGIVGASGAATGLLSVLGGRVAKWLGVGDVDTMLAGAGAKALTKVAANPEARRGLVRNVLGGMVSEGLLEELPQSIQEQIAQNVAAGKPMYEGVDDAAVMGFLAGAVMGGGANAYQGVRERASDWADKRVKESLESAIERRRRQLSAQNQIKQAQTLAGDGDVVAATVSGEREIPGEPPPAPPAAEPPKPEPDLETSTVDKIRAAIADKIAPKAAEERRQLDRAAHTDVKTDLGNARAWEKIKARAEPDPNSRILRFDLNGFKAINDKMGHQEGDRILGEIGKIIRENAPGAAAARPGGDEFAVAVTSENPDADAARIRDAIEIAVGVRDAGGVKYSISGGIGNTEAEADAEAIARKAQHKKAQGIAGRDQQQPVEQAPPVEQKQPEVADEASAPKPDAGSKLADKLAPPPAADVRDEDVKTVVNANGFRDFVSQLVDEKGMDEDTAQRTVVEKYRKLLDSGMSAKDAKGEMHDEIQSLLDEGTEPAPTSNPVADTAVSSEEGEYDALIKEGADPRHVRRPEARQTKPEHALHADVHRALVRWMGANKVNPFEEGMPDNELRKALEDAWGEGGHATKFGTVYTKGASWRLEPNAEGDAMDLGGKKLLDMARELVGVPRPGETTAEKEEPAPASKKRIGAKAKGPYTAEEAAEMTRDMDERLSRATIKVKKGHGTTLFIPNDPSFSDKPADITFVGERLTLEEAVARHKKWMLDNLEWYQPNGPKGPTTHQQIEAARAAEEQKVEPPKEEPVAAVAFRSGASRASDIRGLADAGQHVGVAVNELTKESIDELMSLAGKKTQVFVDSGIFSDGEISEAEWNRRINIYIRLATDLGEQLHVVAPDKIGDQAATLALLKTFRVKLQGLAELGAHVLVPIQKGDGTAADFYGKVLAILKFDFVPAMPMKKSAMTPNEVIQFVQARKPAAIHLLGLGPENKASEALINGLRSVSPDIEITQDSNALRARIGRTNGPQGGPRELTANVDAVKSERGNPTGEVEGEFGEKLDYTDDIAQPSKWLPEKARADVAAAAGLSEPHAHRFVRFPDAFLQEEVDGVPRWEDPQMAAALDDAWKKYVDKSLAKSDKAEGIRRTFDETKKPRIGAKKQEPDSPINPKGEEQASAPAPAKERARDKVVKKLDAEAEAALARIKARGKRLMSGIDPEELADYAVIGAAKIARGVVELADWSEQMIAMLGEAIRPHLRRIYGLSLQRFDNEMEAAGAADEGEPLADESKPASILNEEEPDAGSVRTNVEAGASEQRPEDVPGAAGERAPGIAGERGPGEGGRDLPADAEGSRGESSRTGGIPGESPVSSDDAGNGPRDDVGSDPAAERGGSEGGKGRVRRRRKPDADVTGTDFRITDELGLGEGGERTKARDNIAAIELALRIRAEQRPATREEQAILARYVGWGGLKPVFEPKGDKFYQEIYDKLQALLTPEEFAAARASVLNAHYTSKGVIEAMWAAVKRLGFNGGKVLEPGAGVGNFLGLIPEDIAGKTHFTAVELDKTSALIGKLLYPNQNFVQSGFEKVKIPDGSVDLAIGNPPFGDYPIFDESIPKELRQNIHDYFFVRALKALRPGGVLAFVTSDGTMDKTSTTVRKYLAQNAKLLAAFRLPNTTFEENARTKVTTDLIILQKLAPGQVSAGPAWMDVVSNNGFRINEYFANNIQNMLGHMEKGGLYSKDDQHLAMNEGQTPTSVIEHLKGRMRELPADIIPPRPRDTRSEGARTSDQPLPDNNQVRDGGLMVSGTQETKASGKVPRIMRREGNAMVDAHVPASQAVRVAQLIGLRDAVNDVRRANNEGNDAKIDKAKEALRKLYYAFVKEYGPINAQERAERTYKTKDGPVTKEVITYPNLTSFVHDPDSPLVRALEKYDYDKHQELGAKYRPEMTDISRTKVPEKRGRVESGRDAIILSLNERGRVDLDYMAEITGKKPSALMFELRGQIFRNPESDQWETRDQYLSGDVKKKLKIVHEAYRSSHGGGQQSPYMRYIRFFDSQQSPLDAAVKMLQSADPKDVRMAEEIAADPDAYLFDNYEELKKVIPKDLTPDKIAAVLGAPWIPANTIATFAKDVLGLRKAPKIVYNPITAKYFVESHKNDGQSAKNTRDFGTPDITGVKLLEYALNMSHPIIRRPLSDGSSVVDHEATLIADEAMDRLKNEFALWAWRNDARALELARIYNEKHNTTVLPQPDGSYLEMQGMATHVDGQPFAFQPHQRNFIARFLQWGRAAAFHVVGAGKTFAAIGAIMEAKRLGLVRKPIITVPNHMLGQWTHEFLQLYPGANLLVATEHDFDGIRRRNFTARMAASNYDAIIMTHSAFELIPVSMAAQEGYIREEMDDLETVIRAAREEDASQGRGRSSRDNRLVRDLERRKRKLEAKLEELLANEKKDDLLDFEELGIDHITVDEAHMFKNLRFNTTLKGIAGKPSERATDLEMKLRHVHKVNPKHSVMLLTGTPISRSFSEAYVMQRFMQPEVLKEKGLMPFDAWAKTFARERSMLEMKPGRGFKMTPRFDKFVNLGEFAQMFRSFADVQMAHPEPLKPARLGPNGEFLPAEKAEDFPVEPNLIRLPRPAIIGDKPEVVLIERYPAMDRFMKWLEYRAKYRMPHGRPKKGDDNLMAVTFDGRYGSLDLRTVVRTAVDHPGSKLNRAVEKIAEIYHDSTPYKGTQIVFSDIIEATKKGVPGFNVYEELTNKLVAAGVRRSEIADIRDAKTSIEKMNLFMKVRAGEVRVLIGSTDKMGAGTNVQTRLVAEHQLDVKWNPSDVEQREGRILRQGNVLLAPGPDGKPIIPGVRILRYATKGSVDGFQWGLVSRKTRMVHQGMTANAETREIEDLDDQAMSAAEIAAAAADDPRIIRRAELDAEVARLERMKRAYADNQWSIKSEAATLPKSIEAQQRNLADFQKDAARAIAAMEKLEASAKEKYTAAAEKAWTEGKPEARAAWLGEEANIERPWSELATEEREKVYTAVNGDKPKRDFSITIRGTEYTDRPSAVKALVPIIEGVSKGQSQMLIGSFMGFPLHVQSHVAGGVLIGIEGASLYDHAASVTNPVASVEALLNQIPKRIEETKERIADYSQRLQEAKERADAPFPQEQELADKRAEFLHLNVTLAAESKAREEEEKRTGHKVDFDLSEFEPPKSSASEDDDTEQEDDPWDDLRGEKDDDDGDSLDSPARRPRLQAAYVAKSGKTYTDDDHTQALYAAQEAGEPEVQGFPDDDSVDLQDIESRMGFVDPDGRYMTRAQTLKKYGADLAEDLIYGDKGEMLSPASRATRAALGGVNRGPSIAALESPAAAETTTGARIRNILGMTPANQSAAVDRVKSLRTIVTNLSEAINLPIRQGRFRAKARKAAGIFFTKAEVARIVRMDMLDTAAHEVGHYISKHYLGSPTRRIGVASNAAAIARGLPKLTRRMKAELVAMGKALYLDRKPNGGYGEEGIAEWTMFYVMDPSQLATLAPTFTTWMETHVLSNEPGLKTALDGAQKDYAAFQRAPYQAQIDAMISVKPKNRWRPSIRGLITTMFDDIHELKIAVQELGNNVSAAADAYLLARLTRGGAGMAAEMVENGVVDPRTGKRVTRGLKAILADVGRENLQEFRRYLVAERTLEVAERGINTGVSLNAARKAVAALRDKYGALAEDVWEISNALVQYRVAKGLITQEAADEVLKNNKRRVGLFRVFDEQASVAWRGVGRGFGRNNSGMQRMKGSAREIIDPLESMITDIYRTVQQGHSAEVLSALVDQAEQTEGGGRVVEILTERPMRAVDVPLEDIKWQLEELGITVPNDPKLQTAVLTKFEYLTQAGGAERKDLVKPLVRDGRRIWVQLKDSRLYDAVEGLGTPSMPTWLRVASIPTRTLRAGATLTAEFLTRNPVRDAVSASINTKAGWKYAVPGALFARGIFEMLTADPRVANKIGMQRSDLYEKWRLAGGDNAAMLGIDRVEVAKTVEELTRTNRARAAGWVLHPIDTLRMVSSLFENATRLGEFAGVRSRLLRAGASERDANLGAALASRDVTIDFNQAGTVGRQVNQLMAFFNANARGWAKLKYEIQNHPETAIPRIIAWVTLPSIILYLAQKDDPEWDKIPAWQKSMAWIIIDRDKDGNLKHIWRIPKPPDLGIIFGTLPVRLTEWALQEDPRAGQHIMRDLYNLQPFHSPEAITPIVEWWANKSFFTERDIVPTGMQKLPAEDQATSRTGELMRTIGGAVNLSPAKLENLTRNLFGGLGTYGMDIGDVIVREGRRIGGMRPLPDPRRSNPDSFTRAPVLRGFTVRRPELDAQPIQDALDSFKEADARRLAWRGRLREGDEQGAAEYFRKYEKQIRAAASSTDGLGSIGPLRVAYDTILDAQEISRGADAEERRGYADQAIKAAEMALKGQMPDTEVRKALRGMANEKEAAELQRVKNRIGASRP